MPIYVSEAFALAVKAFFAAADGGGGSAPAFWAKVEQEGAKIFLENYPSLMKAGEAVINGEAIIFRAQMVNLGPEAGFISAGGLAAGLIVSAALVFVVAGFCVWQANRRDLEVTRRAAYDTYLRQYLPRYIKFALQRMQYGNRVPPAPFTFEEYWNLRGDKTLAPAKL